MESREKILDTATRLFSAQGYGATSLAQVAKEAEVSKALIFWHFENKEKLFQSALQHTLEPYFINVVEKLEGLDELGQITKLVDLYAEFVDEHTESVRFVLSLLLREEGQPEEPVGRIGELFRVYRKLLADILQSGLDKGVFRSDLDPSREAGLLMAMMNGLLVENFLDRIGATSGNDVGAHFKEALHERLVPPAGSAASRRSHA